MKKVLLLLTLCAPCFGQAWSGLLAPSRAIDWSHVGANVVNRTAACPSQPGLTAGSGSGSANASAINISIQSNMGGNCVINLPAGTFYVSGEIMIRSSGGTGNITVRGAGANSTFLIFTNPAGSGCGINPVAICVYNGDGDYPAGVNNPNATWTGGYKQGTTGITLSSVTNLKVGMQLVLNQVDPGSDTGNIWSCQTHGSNGTCSQQGAGGIARNNNGQFQTVIVASCGATSSGAPCTSNNVTITPGLYAPNWCYDGGSCSASKPSAWWGAFLPIQGVGIENMSLDISGFGGGSAAIVAFFNSYNSWASGLKTINGTVTGKSANDHVLFWLSNHMTHQNSYMYGSDPGSGGYGTDSAAGSADNLAQNNISQHVAGGALFEGCTGCVLGYNYDIDNFFGQPGATWQAPDTNHHSVGDAFNLIEGVMGSGMEADTIHGTSWMMTHYRDYYTGHDLGAEFCGTPGCKNQATFALGLMSYSRYFNIVNGVYGSAGFHTNYQSIPSSATDCGSMANSSTSVMALGWADQAGVGFSSACGVGSFTINNDSLVQSTLMRWGNYDTVTGAVRKCTGSGSPDPFCTGDERSAAAPMFPGLSNPSTNFPCSLYLPCSTPSWWKFPSGTANTPFPGIGGDVTGGNVSGVAGHVFLNAAANCYLNVMHGATNGSSGVLSFDASSCYGGGGGNQGPTPPTGLKATVQ